MTKRGAKATRPPDPGQWTIRYATQDSGNGWENLCQQQPNVMRMLFDRLSDDPLHSDNRDRQHPLKGSLGTAVISGRTLPQWQFELAGGGRVWYAIDETTHTVWITTATARHPNETK
jgi:hypothetical protein